MLNSFYVRFKIGAKQSLTPEGFLLCEDVPIARTGMMKYSEKDFGRGSGLKGDKHGLIRIYRDEDEVFRPETIASANGKPLVNDHPVSGSDVTANNWEVLAKGVVLNARRGTGAADDLLLADILVTTADAIQAIQNGKREISCGYDADYVPISVGKYRHTNIIINHVALVDRGRCGARCTIHDHQGTEMSKILEYMLKAREAKDEEEVRVLFEQAKFRDNDDEDDDDDEKEGPKKDPEPIKKNIEPEEGESKAESRALFTDADIKSHMDQNAKEHAEMFSRIAHLEGMVNTPAKAKDDDTKTRDAIMREIPEGEQALKVGDSSYLVKLFQDTVAQAEIIMPGFRIPTFDAKYPVDQGYNTICEMRRKVLDQAYIWPDTKVFMDDLVGDAKFDTRHLTCDALRVAFNAVSALKRTSNNKQPVGFTSPSPSQGYVPRTPAEINEFNRKYYSAQ